MVQRTVVSPSGLGEDHTAGPWQKTGAVGEGGPAHSDNSHGGALQLRWSTRSPWLLEHRNEETGRGHMLLVH